MSRPKRALPPSNGARILLSFVALTYALPATAQLLLEPELRFHCPDHRPAVWAHFAIALAALLLGGKLASRPPQTRYERTASDASRIHPALSLLTAAGFALGLSSLTTGVSARYGAVTMAERFAEGGGVAATATLLLQAIVPLLPWWLLLRNPSVLESGQTSSTLLRIALAVAVATSINGLSSAVRATISIVIVALPRTASSMLLSDAKHKPVSRRMVLTVTAIAAAAIPLAAIGMRAKTGSVGDDATWSRYLSPSYLAGRNSTHFQHALGALEIGIDEGDRTGEFLDRATIAWSDAAYRVGVLAGNPAWGQRPEPSSLSRYTFERFALFEPSERMARGGSSPSIIAAFALCLPPPWSFAAMAGFAWVLVRWLDWLLAGTPRLSWLGCAIIAFGPLRAMTDTPTDLLNPFGIPFVIVTIASIARLLSSPPTIEMR